MEDSEKFECVIANLRTLLKENCNGVWLSNLAEKYEERFGYSMTPELLGFDGFLDLVTNFPSIIKVQECRAERDKLLFPANAFDEEEHGYRKETRNSTVPNHKEEVQIPRSLLNELKKLLSHNEKGLFTDVLLKEYRIMYQKHLKLSDLGFPNLDSFLQHLETRCSEFSFRHVGDRGYVISLKETSDATDSRSPSKKSDSSSGNFNFDSIPPEACDGDTSFEIDPYFEQVSDGDVFEIEIAEVYSPEKFYIMHISRTNLLNSLMADLDQFYKSYEKHYKIQDSVISRGLLCACTFSKTSAWHRARINHVNWTSKEAEVVYVDYGTTEIVSLEKLRFLHKDFAKYPALCFLASLSGVQPKEGFNYSTECGRKFYRFISVRDLEVEVVKMKPDCLEVHLFARTDEGKINIAEELIKMDLVRQKVITRANPSPTKSLYEDTVNKEHIPILEYDGRDFRTIRGETSRVPSFTRTDNSKKDQKTRTVSTSESLEMKNADLLSPNESLHRVANASFTSDHEIFESNTSQAAETLTSGAESPDFLSTLGRPSGRVKTSDLLSPNEILHHAEDAIFTPDLAAPENLATFPPESPMFSPPYSVPPTPLIPQGVPYGERFYASVPPNVNFPYPASNMYQNYYPMMQPNFPPMSYPFPPPAFYNPYPNLTMPYAYRPPVYQNTTTPFRPPPGIANMPKWTPYAPFPIPTSINMSYQSTVPQHTNYFGTNGHFTSGNLMGSQQSCLNTHHSKNEAGSGSCRCKFCPTSMCQSPSQKNSTESQDWRKNDDQIMKMEELLREKLLLEAAIERERKIRNACTERNISNCVESDGRSNVSVKPSHHRSTSSLKEPIEPRNAFHPVEKNDGCTKAFFEKPLFFPNKYTPVEKKISRHHESTSEVTIIDETDDHEDCACKLCSVSKPEIKNMENKLCGEYSADEEEDDMENLQTIDKTTEKLKKALRIAENNEDSEDSAYASTLRGETPELRETDVLKELLFNKASEVKRVDDESETFSLPSPSRPKNSDRKSFSSIRAFVLQEAQKLSP